MKKIINLFFQFFLIVATCISLNAQIAINNIGDAPTSSAMLDISSSEKGILIPRLSTTERDAISSAAQSLLIYNTTTMCFEFWENGTWNPIGCVEFPCGDTLIDTRDGNKYTTVQIGDQCWFAENLRYDNGCSSVSWVNSTDVGWCGYYLNDESTYGIYGLLYQWSAIMNGESSCNGTGEPPNDECSTPAQGICPDGWHIPSHYEWTTLERAVCTTNCEVLTYNESSFGFRGTSEASKLAGNANLWVNNNLENNADFGTSGFNGLPAGIRASDGSFNSVGYSSSLWSSYKISTTTSVWFRALAFNYTTVSHSTTMSFLGKSARCIKDN